VPPASLLAEGGGSAVPAAPGLDAGQVLSVLLGLAAVLVAIVALSWVLRTILRLQGGAGPGPLRVVAALSLGPRERVVLVEVGAAQVLVGVTPGRIQPLHILGEGERVEGPVTAPVGTSGFGAHLTRLMDRAGGG
jgi:flagellar protein FliO/FliZ